jgi:phospholipase/lecithinase/hemolysin
MVTIELEEERIDSGQLVNWTLNLSTAGGWLNIDQFVYQGYSNNGSLRYQDSALWSTSSGTHYLAGGSIAGFEVFNGTYEYTIRVEVWDQNRTQMLASDEQTLLIFRHTIAPTPTKFIVFGDSLSDMGNTYNTVAQTPESPPYWNGRFSNGPVWAELVGQGLGQTIRHGTGSSGDTNRAWGGAQSGGGYTSWVIPNSGLQVQEYTDNHYIQPTEMVAIWIGGNDFVGGNHPNVQEVVDNIASDVNVLAQNGATNIFILDMPSLEKTPKNQDDSDSDKQALHDQMIDFNSKLASDMNSLSQSLNITIDVIPMMGMFESIYWNKSFYGITYHTVAACPDGGDVCDSNDYIAPNPNEFIFFDQLHPTANMHFLLSTYVLEQIGIADTDADGVADTDDNCSQTPLGDAVNHFGCRLADLDSDDDGVNDALDLCPGTAENMAVDEDGCADYQKDGDGDGVMDDMDICSDTAPIGIDVDENGCADYQKDSDGDGVTDDVDVCPDTDAGVTVNEIGCAQNQIDNDWDGVMNDRDLCPGTPLDEEVDLDGCALSQLDSDEDGVTDDLDLCPGTPAVTLVDEVGCALSQLDTDLDGISDADDECPFTPPTEQADERGCSATQRDSDDDGRNDAIDECPLLAGSIRGCPRLELELVIDHYPAAHDDNVTIRVLFTCENNCTMRLLAIDQWRENLTDGEIELEIPAHLGTQSFELRLEASHLWSQKDFEIIWPEPPAEEEPQDDKGPEPDDSADDDGANSDRAAGGWQASETVELLLIGLFSVLIFMVVASIFKGGNRGPPRQDWRDPSALSTFEVERELRSTPNLSPENPLQVDPSESPPSGDQKPSPEADQESSGETLAGYGDIPGVGDLLD